MIYLDNAATSWPKPKGVSDAMKRYLDEVGAPVNRSVYAAAQEAGATVLRLRERLRRYFGFPEDVSHVILTAGCTAAVNQALCGTLKPGDHVLVSGMEHNAVMRPLTALSEQGVCFDRIPCDRDGNLVLSAVEAMIRPETAMLILCHASNVCGTVQDAEAVGKLCAAHGIAFVLDAAQSAGHIPVNFARFRLSALCVPAHKGLLGPSGLGALLVTDTFARKMRPLILGGTGSMSDSESQPPYLPDRFESGTMNLPGIYGWEKAMEFLERTDVRPREEALTARFLSALADAEGVRVCGTNNPKQQVGVISVDFPGKDNAEAADRLEQEFGILTRCGLHCAPAAHRTLGTFPQGTVRFSVGYFNTEEEIDAAAAAVRTIGKERT